MEPMKFKVPAGTKEIKIEEIAGQIVTSFIPEKTFKNGDFITCHFDGIKTVVILDGEYQGESNDFDSKISVYDKKIKIGIGIGCRVRRTDSPSTDYEKKQLLDAMKEIGLDWDAEKLEVVPYVWRPKVGDVYYTPIITGDKPSVVKDVFNGTISDKYRLKTSRAFRTEELCNACLNEIINVLKTAKHF
jgi:hypothetical protein